jgi:hypothetical protein
MIRQDKNSQGVKCAKVREVLLDELLAGGFGAEIDGDHLDLGRRHAIAEDLLDLAGLGLLLRRERERHVRALEPYATFA